MTIPTGDRDHDFWTGVAELVNTVAADITRTIDLDLDDLVGDTLLALVEHANRNPQWVTDGRDKTNYVTIVTGRRARWTLHKMRRNTTMSIAPAVIALTHLTQSAGWDEILNTFGPNVDVRPDFVSEYIATRIRKRIMEAGGVTVILNRWEHGTITDDETYALFNPWGSTNGAGYPPPTAAAWCPPPKAQQEAVAQMLRLAGAHAGDLWNLAVRESTRYDQRSRQHTRRGRRGRDVA